MNWKRRTVHIAIMLLLMAGLASLAGYLVYSGAIRPNHLFAAKYPVQGIDASHYQGDIDWPLLESQHVDFAFVKATEGRDYIDPNFEANWRGARQTGIRVGAYHYFTFTSSGTEQARHFIDVVPASDDMLPPVVDLEFDAAKQKNMLARDAVIRELSSLLQELETHYGMKPVIYATVSTYQTYVQGNFDGYDLWIRHVYIDPALAGIHAWTFWQYSDQGRLQGYSGPELHIDLDAFSGTQEQFRNYPAKLQ